MSNVDQKRINELRLKITLAAASSSSREIRDAAHHMKPVIDLLQSLVDRIEQLEGKKP